MIAALPQDVLSQLLPKLSRAALPVHKAQESMAMMLGVQRPSIALTAGKVQRAGMIKHGRGVVTVLGRPSLEASSCECCGAVRRKFAALLCTAVA